MINTENVTLADYRGLSDELLKNLSGNDGAWWLSSLKRFLRKENPFDPRFFEPWQIISFGGVDATPLKLMNACKKYQEKDFVDDIIFMSKNFETTKEKKYAELLFAPIKMLGFERDTSIYEVNKRIVKLGFRLMTLEMVFNFHCQDDKKHDLLRVAMQPFEFPDGQKKCLMITDLTIRPIGAERELSTGHNVLFVKSIS